MNEIRVKSFPVNPLEENCYIVSDESGEACVIDCGCALNSEWEIIKDYIETNHLKIVHALCTHGHADHIIGFGLLFDEYAISPVINQKDQYLYDNLEGQLRSFMIPEFKYKKLPPISKNIKEGDTITFGSHTFSIFETPGHTQGGVCFYCEENGILFSGDTLFQGSVGRSDLSGGNAVQLVNSITEKLLTLPYGTKVFPGHGPSTTIGYESTFNPFL